MIILKQSMSSGTLMYIFIRGVHHVAIAMVSASYCRVSVFLRTGYVAYFYELSILREAVKADAAHLENLRTFLYLGFMLCLPLAGTLPATHRTASQYI